MTTALSRQRGEFLAPRGEQVLEPMELLRTATYIDSLFEGLILSPSCEHDPLSLGPGNELWQQAVVLTPIPVGVAFVILVLSPRSAGMEKASGMVLSVGSAGTVHVGTCQWFTEFSCPPGRYYVHWEYRQSQGNEIWIQLVSEPDDEGSC